jgi:hypothetical protein
MAKDMGADFLAFEGRAADGCRGGVVLDGAQDSDDPGAVAALGMPMGVGG